MADAIGPVAGNLLVYTDTDNTFDFPVFDEKGDRIADLTGWTANLEVDADFAHSATKLTVAASVIADPDDSEKNVLRVVVTDDQLQVGTASDQWNVARTPLAFPYSLKRTNAGAEKELRVGKFIVARARV